MKQIFALLSGLLFGLGLIVSGMADPAKVLNFLDLFGNWDPSLAFVMGGAIAVTAPGFALLFANRQTPYFDQKFRLPTRSDLEPKLITGAAPPSRILAGSAIGPLMRGSRSRKDAPGSSRRARRASMAAQTAWMSLSRTI